jgi:hypothetical protein
MLNGTYTKFYNPSEHLAVDEVTVLIKGSIIVKQYIQNEHNCFDIKIYKLCDMTGYIYNMSICLGKDMQNASQTTATTHDSEKSH